MSDTLEAIQAELLTIRESQIRTEGRLAAGDDRMDRIEDSVEKLGHTVDGNGRQGLRDRVNSLESTRAFQSRIFWMIAGAATTSFVGGVVVAVVYLVRVVRP